MGCHGLPAMQWHARRESLISLALLLLLATQPRTSCSSSAATSPAPPQRQWAVVLLALIGMTASMIGNAQRMRRRPIVRPSLGDFAIPFFEAGLCVFLPPPSTAPTPVFEPSIASALAGIGPLCSVLLCSSVLSPVPAPQAICGSLSTSLYLASSVPYSIGPQAAAMPVIYLSIGGSRDEAVELTPDLSESEVRELLCSAADTPESSDIIIKLYNSAGALIPIGSKIAANTPSTRYKLVLAKSPFVSKDSSAGASRDGAIDQKHAAVLSSYIKELNAKVEGIQKLVAETSVSKPRTPNDLGDVCHGLTPNPATRRIKEISLPEVEVSDFIQFSPEVTESLKHPTFDIWKYSEEDMISLLAEMFSVFGLIEHFKINKKVLYRFLQCIRRSYNVNPFHNFRHCFCVSQMMYGLLNVTGVHTKLTHMEKLVLLVSCIGHDLDHPGYNNAYQINASTELAIVYNDGSPLESHHAAVLFTILKSPETNILANLSEGDYKEARKHIINCILATDMAKHGEILGKFKSVADSFNFDDQSQRQLLLQIIIKCADISNEVRPKHVSEPWVDNLLEEFFTQSDREKAEGLPTAPFMDRQKVTKGSAQVGFIGFVMIPLFELVAKVLPNMDEPVIQPIKKALEYYKTLLEKPAA
ncbi:uncharacterized protein BJ171DRAFT_525146 [Polychytrium aggregatum]|uniref:uncharacterized protein n=1 Tax=Polychytrium aggregatum TaxID=110093 RepID=UPI0022FEC1F5|nr:uncharacterized protein BJ171DRAFT_525146 [Polychytrium aggregatum]KAI9193593.1 hypothetical protein BJ171DRAFT_525146 [Polychytrium aggregatum]